MINNLYGNGKLQNIVMKLLKHIIKSK